ncbi:hypothetical protein AMECASPLE_005118 [Ameca splendens]|uniref:Uncharacterized protein n=1 Tax=Ameca splendens TaxID=208324 RepID=A0ABV0XN20_9TELE
MLAALSLAPFPAQATWVLELFFHSLMIWTFTVYISYSEAENSDFRIQMERSETTVQMEKRQQRSLSTLCCVGAHVLLCCVILYASLCLSLVLRPVKAICPFTAFFWFCFFVTPKYLKTSHQFQYQTRTNTKGSVQMVIFL